jgi:hypothetical protein
MPVRAGISSPPPFNASVNGVDISPLDPEPVKTCLPTRAGSLCYDVNPQSQYRNHLRRRAHSNPDAASAKMPGSGTLAGWAVPPP